MESLQYPARNKANILDHPAQGITADRCGPQTAPARRDDLSGTAGSPISGARRSGWPAPVLAVPNGCGIGNDGLLVIHREGGGSGTACVPEYNELRMPVEHFVSVPGSSADWSV